MRLANLEGRATIVTDDGLIDVATSSQGAFSTSVDKCISQLALLQRWYESAQPAIGEATTPAELFGDRRLGPVVTNPQQIFAIGVNYRSHAEEMNRTLPEEPMVFTKFVSALCGPNDELPVPSDTTDFEVELVAIIGATARNLSEELALTAVAGYCVGQDFSERTLQMKGSPSQFSLAKSFRHFMPIGPWLTTPDELGDVNKLSIGCRVNDIQYQASNTDDMVFGVAQLVTYLSNVVELRPGDVIFTGSPHGVGVARRPPIFLKPGDRVVSEIEGLGRIENQAV
jgi:2-keto-4-pentenoate hydratase/2-oxohepta-3-ene-1,7-dioic acid hydratase in catechol pathway